MVLPNFLIIGAGKSGTTALYTYLKQHPDVYMPEQKELRFFSYTSPAPSSVPKEYRIEGVTSLEEYQGHFKDWKMQKAIGEASPTYLYTIGTAERIHATLPDVRLIAILRNPVEQAYSAYLHAVRDWCEPARDFAEALTLEEERIQAGWGMLWHYKRIGLYSEQLGRYQKVFNPEQMKVVLYDDLVNAPGNLLKELFLFLEVDPLFSPDMTEHPNVSGAPKSVFLHRLMKAIFMKPNPIKFISRLVLPKSVRRNFMLSIRAKNLQKQQMSQEDRQYLMAFFREDILKLQDTISRDLSGWLLPRV